MVDRPTLLNCKVLGSLHFAWVVHDAKCIVVTCVCVLCVCLCVYLSAAVRPHYCTDLDVTWGRGRGCPLVVHCWADLQSGHGLRCYGNITRTLVTSLRLSCDNYDDIVRTLGGVCARRWPLTGGWRGAFSTLLRRPGLMRASNGGVLAT